MWVTKGQVNLSACIDLHHHISIMSFPNRQPAATTDRYETIRGAKKTASIP